ncbi:DUF1642 domain-containing protein [Streptococcus dysgalactiae]|uniref:DUF1642 domain-containing protein n=1 Tax=Streptococcus dysgalactiae TaxID=1334 RepID=UPI00069CFFDA|nr:DUF1642 domain-containing protein [Streptococcus dysgalactiae]
MKIENKKAYIPCEIVENQINNGLNIRVRIDKTHDLYINRKLIIPDIDQPKPVVPKFVAEWIEECKEDGSTLSLAYDVNAFSELAEWLYDTSDSTHIDLFAQAWLAYPNITVKKEKLYTVEIPNPNIIGNEHTVLMKNGFGQIVMLRVCGDDWRTDKDYQITESEIRKDFDWAWQFMKEVTDL